MWLQTWLSIIDDGISDRPRSIYRAHLCSCPLPQRWRVTSLCGTNGGWVDAHRQTLTHTDTNRQTDSPTHSTHAHAQIHTHTHTHTRTHAHIPHYSTLHCSAPAVDFAKIATAYTREMSALKEVLEENEWNDSEAQITSYFQQEAVYFRDLSDQLGSIVSELEEMQEVIQNLFQVYRVGCVCVCVCV